MLREMRESHLFWTDYLDKHPKYRPTIKDFGDAKFHRECVKEYEYLINTIREHVA